MVTKEQLTVGSHVTLGNRGGVIEYLFDEYVLVRWEDNDCIGVLYFNHIMVPNAFELSTGQGRVVTDTSAEDRADQDA